MLTPVSFVRMVVLACSLLVLGNVAADLAYGQQDKLPGMGYKHVEGWPGLPDGWNFGEVPGLATDAQGHVFVFHRGPHPIMEFESNGKFMRSWGDGMISWLPGPEGHSRALVDRRPQSINAGAHTIHVDPEGNIWIVDDGGSDVVKMNPQGRVIMELGRQGVPGTGHGGGCAGSCFNMPTDVAFAPNGDFYVTDGYANTRVVKFSHDGKFLLEWGGNGTGPGEFLLPHAAAVDAQGKVYIADREAAQIKVFDPDGKPLKQWKNLGSIGALQMTKDQHLWAAGGGRVLLLNLEGQIVGSMLPSGQAVGGHGFVVSDTGDIGEIDWQVQKWVKDVK